jgi:hypothetical protein
VDPAFQSVISRGQGARARVLALRLQPLQLGHLFLLERLECAFPFETERAGLADLVSGVLVCSLPWRKAEKTLRAWWLPLFMRLWEKVTRKHPKAEAARVFQEYLTEEMTAPATKGAGGEITAPLPFRILTMLMVDFHMTEAEAMNCEVKKAMCLWVTEGDRRQTIQLLSERQLNFAAWVEEQERARLAGLVKEQEGK